MSSAPRSWTRCTTIAVTALEAEYTRYGVSVVTGTLGVSSGSSGPFPLAWPMARSIRMPPWRRTHSWSAGWTPVLYRPTAASHIFSTASWVDPSDSGQASIPTVVTVSRSSGRSIRRSGSPISGKRGSVGNQCSVPEDLGMARIGVEIPPHVRTFTKRSVGNLHIWSSCHRDTHTIYPSTPRQTSFSAVAHVCASSRLDTTDTELVSTTRSAVMNDGREHQSDQDPAPLRHADAERVTGEQAEQPLKDESTRAQDPGQDAEKDGR